MSGAGRRRILAVTDSDSYVKWGASLVDRMPGDWLRDLVVLDTLWRPSAAQLATAVAGTRWHGEPPPVVSLAGLRERVAAERPDAVLFAMRGPAVKVALREVLAGAAGGPRPVLVSGLPGISVPATRRAIAYRAQVDLMVVHSRRERQLFSALAERMGAPQSFGLATLPFLPSRTDAEEVADGPIVFATQAKIPAVLSERMTLLAALVETARAHPDRRVVIKVRTVSGEVQTHHERHGYPELLAELDPPAPPNLVVLGGPMAEQLRGASGLVTVSSTAVLEAIALGVPALCIDDFGVRDGLVNTVFEGSGLLGSTDELVAGRFRHPDPAWLDEDYFHGAEHDDWATLAERAIAARDAGRLPLRAPRGGTTGGRLRLAWDRKKALGDRDDSLAGRIAVLVGTPAARALRTARDVRRALRARGFIRTSALVDDADADEQSRERSAPVGA